MAALTVEQLKQQYDDNQKIQIPGGVLLLHDTMANPVVTNFGTTADDFTFPTSTFGGGILAKDAGWSLSDELSTSEIEGAGYSSAVRTYAGTRDLTLTAGYIEVQKKGLLEAVLGQTITGSVGDDANILIPYVNSPNWPGLRGYAMKWFDTPAGPFIEYFIFPNLVPKSMPTVSAKGEVEATEIEWAAQYDATVGYSVARGFKGSGFKAVAAELGFTVTP